MSFAASWQFDNRSLQGMRQNQDRIWRPGIGPRMTSGSGNCYRKRLLPSPWVTIVSVPAPSSTTAKRMRAASVGHGIDTACRVNCLLLLPDIARKKNIARRFQPVARMAAAMPNSAVIPAQLSLAGNQQATAFLDGRANRVGRKYCIKMGGQQCARWIDFAASSWAPSSCGEFFRRPRNHPSALPQSSDSHHPVQAQRLPRHPMARAASPNGGAAIAATWRCHSRSVVPANETTERLDAQPAAQPIG